MIYVKDAEHHMHKLVVEITTGGPETDWILYMDALLEGAANLNETGIHEDHRIMLLRLAQELLPAENQLKFDEKSINLKL